MTVKELLTSVKMRGNISIAKATDGETYVSTKPYTAPLNNSELDLSQMGDCAYMDSEIKSMSVNTMEHGYPLLTIVVE